jgi:hypothetical protein
MNRIRVFVPPGVGGWFRPAAEAHQCVRASGRPAGSGHVLGRLYPGRRWWQDRRCQRQWWWWQRQGVADVGGRQQLGEHARGRRPPPQQRGYVCRTGGAEDGRGRCFVFVVFFFFFFFVFSFFFFFVFFVFFFSFVFFFFVFFR